MDQNLSISPVTQNKDKTPTIENTHHTHQKDTSSSIKNDSKQTLKKEPIFIKSKEPLKQPL